MTSTGDPDVFGTQRDEWHAWQQTPWGRIRYRVVGEILRRTCEALGTAPLRVLDVGGGDGRDALALAAAGHHATVVDQSAAMLRDAVSAAARLGVGDRLAVLEGDVESLASLDLGDFDLVLCHNVLQYLPDTRAAIDALVATIRREGTVSLMAVNPRPRALPAHRAAVAARRPSPALRPNGPFRQRHRAGTMAP